ncbi:MAG TPA: lipopolysaccharide biosynthesis protein [Burkholderiaceae bacterium]|nr:lipopolysaccharide biosynthesis protein [Burkholderiaceae bacterium]
MIGALWRDGAVYALGTIVSRGLGLLLLPLYTRALAPDSFGLLDLIVTTGVLANLVVPLETPQAVARLWNERAAGDGRRRLAATGLTFAAMGYTLFVATGLMFAPMIAALLSTRGDAPAAVRAGVVLVAANGLMLVLQGQFRYALRPRAYATVGVAYSLLMLAGMAVLVMTQRASVSSVLWLQAAAAAVVAVGCAWTLRRDIGWNLDRAELRAMLHYALPLVPASLAVFATLNLHRYVLNSLGTLEQVGLYGLASRLASVATLVLIGVQSALTPLIYVHHAEPDTPANLARLFEAFWGLSLLACLALAVFGPELLALLAPGDYAGAAPLVLWLAPAALLAQMYIFAPGIPLAKKTHWQLALTVASGALGLVLALWLVPHWQAVGAAVSTCAASGQFFAAWLAMGQRLYRLPLRWAPLVAATMAYLVAAAMAAQLVGWAMGVAAWAAKATLLMAMLAATVAVGLLRSPSRSSPLRRAGS